MMQYIRSYSTDATWNLALEQYVFDEMDHNQDYLMLWQNKSAVIVGKHQNTVQEINNNYVNEHEIQVVRRLSGGGAVYHDMGNVNFTFISDAMGESFDFAHFCRPVARTLESLGVNVEISGRNDMTIDGMKFSGNSQYIKNGRIMHHGTIMFDSDLTVVSQALRVSRDKYESKGFRSIKSRMTNVSDHMNHECSTEQFINILEERLCNEFTARPVQPQCINMDKVKKLQSDLYNTWDWNYGFSPDYKLQKKRRFENTGQIEVFIDVRKGCICDIVFYGDYFAHKEQSELADALKGAQLSEASLTKALSQINIGDYFSNLRKSDFTALLLE
ncbi:lipoate--protein ligase [Tyzzerella sp. OttesenSCG-928-J15]|nr:lipoate--protein ligase [Tyzzerella sp. OttesenSCG-928-J15]